MKMEQPCGGMRIPGPEVFMPGLRPVDNWIKVASVATGWPHSLCMRVYRRLAGIY